jgi:hypothetical protein
MLTVLVFSVVFVSAVSYIKFLRGNRHERDNIRGFDDDGQ